MAAQVPRQLKIGTIIDKTLGVVEHNTTTALIYVVALTVINAAITYFSLSLTAPLQQLGIGLVKFVIGVSAAYLLLEALLRKTGLRTRTDEDVFLPYFALSIVSALGVGLGLIVFVIPGLIIMARWSIAQPLLVGRGDGVRKALGESWERTKGNEFEILVAMLALLFLLIAVVIACSILFEKDNLAGIAISQLAQSAMGVMSAAMGVAIYGLIEGGRVAASPAN